MRIGIPRETKDGERRVGARPVGVTALVADGHDVLVQAGTGAAVGHLCAPTNAGLAADAARHPAAALAETAREARR